MFELPLETPWIWIWLGAASLIGLLIGWLIGRRGKKQLKRYRVDLQAELDEANEAHSLSEEAARDSGNLAAALQQQVDDSKPMLAEADREISRLRSEVEYTETRITQLEASLRAADEATHDDVTTVSAQLAAANEKGDTLRAALSAATVDSDARIAAAESEAREAVGRAAAVEDALSAAETERDALAQELLDVHGAAQAEALELRSALDAAEAAAVETLDESGHAGAGETIALLGERLAETEAQLEEARAQADATPDGDSAARDHLLSELQARLGALSDVEDRLMAREVELEESRRTHDAFVAAKDAEIRGLNDRIDNLNSSPAPEPTLIPDPATAAELEAIKSELGVMQERALYWEREAAGLRSDLAAESSATPTLEDLPAAATPAGDTTTPTEEQAPLPAPGPVADVDPDAGRLGKRLAEVHDVLADKEARIAYLADRVARLESRATVVGRSPASSPTPDPEPAAAAAVPLIGNDDLTAIWGIGPVIQATLNEAGITTYDQVARLQAADVAHLGDRLGGFLDRIEADDWTGQARRLVEERGGTVPDGPMEPIRLAPPVAPVRHDDLTLIKGIGPYIETTLHDLDITAFAQIASWTSEDVAEVGEALVIFQGRIERERWVEQARGLLADR